jgi:hypothetical protein
MHSIVVAFLVLASSAGAALAQTGPASPSASHATSASIQAAKQKAHAAAIENCEAMWDRDTHMTRKEWSRTCRRVQVRLEGLELK